MNATVVNGEEIFTTISVPRSIPTNRVKDLLVGFFETANSCWLNKYDYRFREGLTKKDFQEGGQFQIPGDYYHPSQIIPMTEGCAVVLTVDDPDKPEGKTKKFVMGPEQIKKGLEVMARDFPTAFNDFLEENDDAITADLFGQCIVYGKDVYC